MEQKFFSIIIPVYKVEKYLNQCVDSILNQTFKNYEIILVDDGSPDLCPSICDEYSKKYDNIKTIHKTNGGLSDARNAGIKVINGKYTILIDSDDFLEGNNTLNRIYNALLQSQADVIILNYYKYWEENNKKHIRKSGKIRDISLSELIKDNIYKACAWNKIIKTDVIKENNMLFLKDRLSEDIDWCAQLIKYANKYQYFDEEVYAYRQRENSISKTVSENHIADVLYMINTNIDESNDKIMDYLAYEYCMILGYIGNIKENKEIIDGARKLKQLLNYNSSKKVKLCYYFYKIFGFELTVKFLAVFIRLKNRRIK